MLIDWLNSENTPKVLFHDERIVEPRGDGTSISQIQLGTRQLGRERGKWSIKRGEVQQERGFNKI